MRWEMPLTLWVFLGGGAGCVLRYWVTCITAKLPQSSVPMATLFANVVGCLAIGLISPRLVSEDPTTQQLRAGLVVGVLGGFTTFSTFALESYRLLDGKDVAGGLMNIAVHNILGIFAVAVGIVISRQL